MKRAVPLLVVVLAACSNGAGTADNVTLFSTTAREHGLDRDMRFVEVERLVDRSVLHTHLKGYGGAVGGSLLTIEVLCDLAQERGFEYWVSLEEGPEAEAPTGFRGWRQVIGFAHDDSVPPFEVFSEYEVPVHRGPMASHWMPADVRGCFESMMTWPVPDFEGDSPAEPAGDR